MTNGSLACLLSHAACASLLPAPSLTEFLYSPLSHAALCSVVVRLHSTIVDSERLDLWADVKAKFDNHVVSVEDWVGVGGSPFDACAWRYYK